MNAEIKRLTTLDPDELFSYAKELRAPYDLVKQTAELGRLPVVNFAAGGIATPADVALMMQLGMDGVFVGSVSRRKYSTFFLKFFQGYFQEC